MAKKLNKETILTVVEDKPEDQKTYPEDQEIIEFKIPLAHWFDEKVKSGQARKHQFNSISIFFKKKGLSEIENPDRYEEYYRSF
jgi:hypothetical protein